MENNHYKRLFRSKTNRSICGVCGGIGAYIGLDPSVIRLVWVIGSVCTAGVGGAFLYLLAALIIPEES